MKRLKDVQKLVESILIENPETRNSDNHLYIVVCNKVCPDSTNKPIHDVFGHLKEYKIPSFESVSRARRKLQSKYPNLYGKEKVQVQRELNEEVYREYARS